MNQDLKVLDSDGNALSETDVVGTGMTVNLYSGESLADSVTIVILGDLDGNGRVDTTDYVRLRLVTLSAYQLSDIQKIAADLDENGTINTTDYMRIKAYCLHEGSI